MSRFNIGDKVTLKACAKQGMGWTHGKEYVVTRVYKDRFGYNRIKTNIDDSGDTTNGWLAEFFEPINTSPICTVTRKEIVPGVYGSVVVDEVFCDSIRYIIHEDANGTATELREAAHILNQIAEVLEDE